jgi:NADH:ubiquinone oxidoreductase subunit 6 (subunit J)
LNLILFYLLAAVILISGLMVVTLRNVFHSALFLILAFFMVAGVYITLSAEFLAAVQVLIYVGAVTILMLFAIMLTYQIQSNSIRQVNEQVIPAAIISALFLALAIFAVTKTFGHTGPAKPNVGSWTASIEADKLESTSGIWDWTVTLDDKTGGNYIAGSNIMIVPQNPPSSLSTEPQAVPNNDPNGYIISANSDFSTKNTIFGKDQTIYLKAWSQNVNYAAVSHAIWMITDHNDTTKQISMELSNNNPETIGRLLMSKFVLPFEVVSVLLLVALVGAIVIARKDK